MATKHLQDKLSIKDAGSDSRYIGGAIEKRD
jgi:hypothetical protein